MVQRPQFDLLRCCIVGNCFKGSRRLLGSKSGSPIKKTMAERKDFDSIQRHSNSAHRIRLAASRNQASRSTCFKQGIVERKPTTRPLRIHKAREFNCEPVGPLN